MSKRKVLVTGAAGKIGQAFAQGAADRYDLRLLVMEGQTVDAPGEVVVGDITDPSTLPPVMAGVDTVVHMAADAHPNAPWSVCLQVNINGTHNIMQAAVDAGCRRVIYASSVHAVDAYPPGYLIRETDAPRPPDLYGVSKATGEALGACFAHKRGLSVISVRIGAFHKDGWARDRYTGRMLPLFISQRDMLQLLVKCVEVEGVTSAVVHGVGDNPPPLRLDLAATKALLGYEPQDGMR